MSVGRKASKDERQAVMDEYEQRFYDTSSEKGLQAIELAKHLGETVEETFSPGGTVYRAIASSYIATARGMPNAVNGLQGEALDKKIDAYLSSTGDYAVVSAVINQFKTIAEKYYSGQATITPAQPGDVGQYGMGTGYTVVMKDAVKATDEVVTPVENLNKAQVIHARTTAAVVIPVKTLTDANEDLDTSSRSTSDSVIETAEGVGTLNDELIDLMDTLDWMYDGLKEKNKDGKSSQSAKSKNNKSIEGYEQEFIQKGSDTSEQTFTGDVTFSNPLMSACVFGSGGPTNLGGNIAQSACVFGSGGPTHVSLDGGDGGLFSEGGAESLANDVVSIITCKFGGGMTPSNLDLSVFQETPLEKEMRASIEEYKARKYGTSAQVAPVAESTQPIPAQILSTTEYSKALYTQGETSDSVSEKSCVLTSNMEALEKGISIFGEGAAQTYEDIITCKWGAVPQFVSAVPDSPWMAEERAKMAKPVGTVEVKSFEPSHKKEEPEDSGKTVRTSSWLNQISQMTERFERALHGYNQEARQGEGSTQKAGNAMGILGVEIDKFAAGVMNTSPQLTAATPLIQGYANVIAQANVVISQAVSQVQSAIASIGGSVGGIGAAGIPSIYQDSWHGYQKSLPLLPVQTITVTGNTFTQPSQTAGSVIRDIIAKGL